jgi:hypothetical protein
VPFGPPSQAAFGLAPPLSEQPSPRQNPPCCPRAWKGGARRSGVGWQTDPSCLRFAQVCVLLEPLCVSTAAACAVRCGRTCFAFAFAFACLAARRDGTAAAAAGGREGKGEGSTAPGTALTRWFACVPTDSPPSAPRPPCARALAAVGRKEAGRRGCCCWPALLCSATAPNGEKPAQRAHTRA